MSDLDLIFVALLALAAVLLVRNEVTYRIRIAILYTRTEENPWAGNELHSLLPSYDRMMLHPAFWLKWTEADWRDYLTRRSEA